MTALVQDMAIWEWYNLSRRGVSTSKEDSGDGGKLEWIVNG